MPHLLVEYSANVVPVVSVPALLRAVHEAALSTGVFEVGAVRTRGARRDDYVVADDHADNAFVAVTVRIARGRDEATRTRVGQAIFAAVCRQLAPAYGDGPLAISVEVQEIDPVGAFKKNNLHAITARRAQAIGP